MQLVPCSHCKRHVAVDERTCPFCAAPLAAATPRTSHLVGRLGRAAVFAGATLAGCSPPPQPHKPPPPPPPPDEVVQQQPPPPPPPDPLPDSGSGVTYAQPPAATATILGTVTQVGTKAPLYGIQVYARGGNVSVAQTTDGSGNYKFEHLAAGTYTLSFQQEPDHPRQGPPPPVTRVVKVADGATQRVNVELRRITTPPDRGPCCKPYGAPPARRRTI